MRALGVIGRILIGAGVVILLFAAYQVLGTSLQEAHTQTALRHTFVSDAKSNQLEQALDQAAARTRSPTGPPAVAPTTNAPAEGQPVGDIRIPKIGINQIMVEGTNTQDLRKGPGHYTGTPLPGQSGNASVAGHRTTYGHPFYNLDGVAVGDPVVVTTVQGVFVYDAVKSEVVSPNDNSVLNNTSGHMLTLTTCNPRFSASSRLVVVAQLAHSKLFSGVGRSQAHREHTPTPDRPALQRRAGRSVGRPGADGRAVGDRGLRRRCARPADGVLLPAPALVYLGRGDGGRGGAPVLLLRRRHSPAARQPVSW